MLRQMHRILRWWVAAQAVAVIPFLPWAWAILRREGGSFGIGWIPPITTLDLPLSVTNLTFIAGNPGRWLTWVGLVLVLVAVVSGAIPVRQSSGCLPPFYRFLLLWLLFEICYPLVAVIINLNQTLLRTD